MSLESSDIFFRATSKDKEYAVYSLQLCTVIVAVFTSPQELSRTEDVVLGMMLAQAEVACVASPAKVVDIQSSQNVHLQVITFKVSEVLKGSPSLDLLLVLDLEEGFRSEEGEYITVIIQIVQPDNVGRLVEFDFGKEYVLFLREVDSYLFAPVPLAGDYGSIVNSSRVRNQVHLVLRELDR